MSPTTRDRVAARCVDSQSHGRGRRLVVAIFVASAVAGGCGRRGLPGTVRVEGRVTFGGNECPAAGCVCFLPSTSQPDAAGTQPRPGWARFERDGLFRVTTLVTDDGLLPGTYDVRVECHAADGRGGPTGHEAGGSLVPAAVSLPPLVVPAGARGPIRHDIDIVARADEGSVDPGPGTGG